MRATILTLALALAAPAAPAQQAQPPDDTGTVAQPRFENGAEVEAVPQEGTASEPRFVNAPTEGGIEVTPLAPPGGTGGARAIDVPLGEPELLEQGVGEDLPQKAAGVEILRGAPQGDPVDGARFVPAPDDGSALTRPSGIAVPIDPPETGARPGVRLRELDKMTGQTETFELAVGETRQVDRLKIRLEACRSPETNDTHGTVAFLKVWDVREPDEEAFSGWMFAQSPSLSALDHPRYDLWVISCTTSAVAASAPSE